MEGTEGGREGGVMEDGEPKGVEREGGWKTEGSKGGQCLREAGW